MELRASLFGNAVKPNVVAPGVNIRSSSPTNNYQSMSGTSMSSPHVAGLVALLWSALPGLTRDLPNTEIKLERGAEIAISLEGCGGEGITDNPNNTFGWGLIDAVKTTNWFNIYTDRAFYASGQTMQVYLSLVNPMPTTLRK